MTEHYYVSKNEIAVENKEDAMKIASILLENGYVTMVSKEESLYIVNYEFSLNSDRNDMIFRSREEWDWEEYEMQKELQREADEEELAMKRMRGEE